MMIAIVFVLFAALIVAWMAAPSDEVRATTVPAAPLAPADSPVSA